MPPAAAIILGAVWYAVFWMGHDKFGTRVGEWRAPPVWLRRLVRFCPGPLYPATLAMQAWALAMLLIGLSTHFGLLSRSVGAELSLATFYLIGPIAVFWLGLMVVDFVRRRS